MICQHLQSISLITQRYMLQKTVMLICRTILTFLKNRYLTLVRNCKNVGLFLMLSTPTIA